MKIKPYFALLIISILSGLFLKIDFGLLLLLGLIIGSAVSMSGYIWMRVLLKKDFKLSSDNKASNSLNHEKKISAFLPIIIPIILISISISICNLKLHWFQNMFAFKIR